MLVYEILRYEETAAKHVGKPHFVSGSHEHREYLFKRTLDTVINDNHFTPGGHVTLRNRKQKAIIIDIQDDIKQIEWTGLKPRFIEVWPYTGEETILVHPSEIVKKGRK